MCKVYNSVGCLTTVKSHLQRHNINEFNSLNEVLNFQKSFSALKQQIISSHEQLIEQEKSTLVADISQLENTIKADKAYFESCFLKDIEEIKQKIIDLSTLDNLNIVQRCINHVKQKLYKKKVQELESSLNSKVNYSIRELLQEHDYKTNRYCYITSNFRGRC